MTIHETRDMPAPDAAPGEAEATPAPRSDAAVAGDAGSIAGDAGPIARAAPSASAAPSGEATPEPGASERARARSEGADAFLSAATVAAGDVPPRTGAGASEPARSEAARPSGPTSGSAWVETAMPGESRREAAPAESREAAPAETPREAAPAEPAMQVVAVAAASSPLEQPAEPRQESIAPAATPPPAREAAAPEPLPIRRRRVAIIGFGAVGRAFVRLLESTRDELAARHRVAFDVTMLATRRSGIIVDPLGIPPAALEELAGIAERAGSLPPIVAGRHVYPTPKGMRSRGPFRDTRTLPDLLATADSPYDVLLELSTASPADGQPAADHLRAALGSGRDAVSANKAPIAWYGRELDALAAAHAGHLRHEATTMDCLPVGPARQTLVPVGRIERFAGVVNSTTNVILSTMAAGGSAEDGLAEARRLGIAEADASNDLEGHDAALKAVILANQLLEPDEAITPERVDRVGISGIEPAWPAEAAARGARVRLVARGEVSVEAPGGAEAGGTSDTAGRRVLRVSVRPEELPFADPLANVDGCSMALTLDTEFAGRLTMTLTEPHVPQTAYALLMDLVAIERARP